MVRRRGLVVLVLGVALAGCGAHGAHAPVTTAAGGAVILNDVSVNTVLDAIAKANLPALNAHDVTSTTCPEAGCVQATDTDTLSVLKFPSTGRAELYAAAVPEMLQVEDIVVVFAPTLTGEQKAAYGQVVKDVMLTPAHT
ncbi:hypothetical protein FHT40_005343 [Mycolicibacterium sp. BK556]|uniref:hypothetical protein n=1 Tax=unclassified Mycolicibacterium TaxID=2636767 RepID=UPI00161083A1|nr:MULTISPECIES: hypothetical protein [unclassified Mycolicibacterium]MBB3605656.1 hypothetical protein [Mycolicibacterium sp. BK556]MBB3635847.1 hypothetical protein [Mycolicibacterium sp. BK607]